MTTTTFDHRATGTAEAAWRASGLDSLPTVQPAAGRLVVLAAHPDDESLGAGGLLAASAQCGADIVVVIATDGDASHPDSSTHQPTELARIRRREVADAVARVAPAASVRHLGLPDGRLSHYGDALDAALASVAPGPVRLVTPWRDDLHPDHEACARAGARLATRGDVEHWEYPIWAWHWADPSADDLPLDRLRRVELTDAQRAAKRAALAEHVSQHSALSDLPGDEAILPPAVLAHFDRPYECFVMPPAAAQSGYFDGLYAADADPWGLADRFYEQRKRAIILATLPRPRFARAFEPGCATGLLTEGLAGRADEVVAWDVAARAREQAADRLAHAGDRVRIEDGRIPAQWPDGSFDLIVLSEVGYYCEDLGDLSQRVLASLTDDGVVLGCHWQHPAVDHPRTAAEVHGALDRVLHRDLHHVEQDFRLDVWSRRGLSVAVAEGIV